MSEQRIQAALKQLETDYDEVLVLVQAWIKASRAWDAIVMSHENDDKIHGDPRMAEVQQALNEAAEELEDWFIGRGLVDERPEY